MGIRILIPRPQKRLGGMRTRRFLWLAAAAAIWGIAYAIFGANGLVGVYRSEADVAKLEATLESAHAVNRDLAERVDGLRSDPQAIEREARDRLGLVKEGDRVYLLPARPSEGPSGDAESESPATEFDSGAAGRH